MIRGLHAMFYCSKAEELRAFLRDKLGLEATELKARGVEFVHDVEDRGFGLVTRFKVPGGFDIQLYQPKYSK